MRILAIRHSQALNAFISHFFVYCVGVSRHKRGKEKLQFFMVLCRPSPGASHMFYGPNGTFNVEVDVCVCVSVCVSVDYIRYI